MFDIGFTAADFRRAVWAFLFGFAATFLLGLNGVLEGLATSCKAGACDWSAAGSAVTALVAGAVVAAFSIVKNLLLSDTAAVK